jgi:CDP-4-dehydro-6-deoxyglucose reductase, E1
MKTTESIREEIKSLVKEYAELQYVEKKFEPGVDLVPPAGKVIGTTELQYMVDASLDGWLKNRSAREMCLEQINEFITN